MYYYFTLTVFRKGGHINSTNGVMEHLRRTKQHTHIYVKSGNNAHFLGSAFPTLINSSQRLRRILLTLSVFCVVYFFDVHRKIKKNAR